MAVLEPLKSGYYIWKYIPSVPLSVISMLLWLAIGGALSWKMYKTRAWFCTSFIIGCLLEMIGYAARASAAGKTGKIMPYIVQSAFTLVPPALFAATIYMCLGRIIRLVGGEHLSIIRPSRLTKVFVWGDVISFLVQGGSTSFTVMADKNAIFPILGQVLVIGGLAIQLVSFSIFGLTALIFHRRLRANPTPRSYSADPSWEKIMHMLYGTSILIIIRSVFRIVEYAMGVDGYALTHEWTLYVFDTIPMLAVAVIFFHLFPTCLTGNRNIDNQVELLESQYSGKPMEERHR